MYGKKSKLTIKIIGFAANALYLSCSSDIMLCGKGALVVNKKSHDQKRIAKFSKDVLEGKVFRSLQVDIELPDHLYNKFSEMPLRFVI